MVQRLGDTMFEFAVDLRGMFQTLELVGIHVFAEKIMDVEEQKQKKTANLVLVTPVSWTFFMCRTTSSTGSTGGLHDIKTTGVGGQE